MAVSLAAPYPLENRTFGALVLDNPKQYSYVQGTHTILELGQLLGHGYIQTARGSPMVRTMITIAQLRSLVWEMLASCLIRQELHGTHFGGLEILGRIRHVVRYTYKQREREKFWSVNLRHGSRTTGKNVGEA